MKMTFGSSLRRKLLGVILLTTLVAVVVVFSGLLSAIASPCGNGTSLVLIAPAAYSPPLRPGQSFTMHFPARQRFLWFLFDRIVPV